MQSYDQGEPLTFTPDHSGTWEVEFTYTSRKNGMVLEKETWRNPVLGWAVIHRDYGDGKVGGTVEPIVVNDEGRPETIEMIRLDCEVGISDESSAFVAWRLVRIRLAEA